MRMDIITIQEDGHCKMCSKELPKGSEVILDDGQIFCFHDQATCHEEYLDAEGVGVELNHE